MNTGMLDAPLTLCIALICRAFGSRMQGISIDSHDAMRSLMWHKDQKSVCALVVAIVDEAQTACQIRSHRPLLAVWTY